LIKIPNEYQAWFYDIYMPEAQGLVERALQTLYVVFAIIVN
jgi:hypothetical protein